MTRDWFAYALIVFTEEMKASPDVLSVSDESSKDSLYRRLPGSRYMPGDTDPVATLIRSVNQQTGIRFKPHQVRSIGTRKVETWTKVKRYGKTRERLLLCPYRFYCVTVSYDDFASHGPLGNGYGIEFVSQNQIRHLDRYDQLHREFLTAYWDASEKHTA